LDLGVLERGLDCAPLLDLQLQLPVERLQLARPLTHRVFERDRGLEEAEGVALRVGAALDPVDQRLDDLAQLLVFARQVGRGELREATLRHRTRTPPR
jgi:hypothetical protein